jgi:hypothetical protein
MSDRVVMLAKDHRPKAQNSSLAFRNGGDLEMGLVSVGVASLCFHGGHHNVKMSG